MTLLSANERLHYAVSLAQAGQAEEAHALLHRIIGDDPAQETAWLWLAQIETDPAMRIRILEECLRHNPQSEYARKALADFHARATGPLQRPIPTVNTPPLPQQSAVPKQKHSVYPWISVLAAVLMGVGAGMIASALEYPYWRDYFSSLILSNPFLPPSATATLTSTATVTVTCTGASTPTATNTPTRTSTSTLTQTPTDTPTRTSTSTFTQTPTETQTPTPSQSRTPTPTRTPKTPICGC